MRGPFAGWGFSAGKRFYSGAMSASTGASGSENARNGAHLLVVAVVVVMVMIVVELLPSC